ncbi:MAG: treZ [Verrucomicrobiaceae bacterium]|nr:treZ [Verrucomicrobiaceae bacterium]
MSARYAYPLNFGAELIDDKRTRFRLWAPDRKTVSVEIKGLSPIAMRRDENGVFECDVYCGAGTCYRYRLDKNLAVPDPVSRLQANDVHDPSVVCDPRDYLWQSDNWRGRPWHEVVVYELHAGCCHGFSGIEQRLEELAALGITAIELMPIGDFSGQRNWGYDGVLPYAPDTSYGTPNELKHLIDSAHRLGICVYLDVVYNHFGPDGNYLSCYASAFFDPKKHSPWGAAIDFSQPQVRNYFTQNALYWLLEYRFDGLRFDAVHQISDPAWLDEMAAEIRAAIEPGRHVHLMLENERNEQRHLHRASPHAENDVVETGTAVNTESGGDFDAQWNDDGHNVLHVLLTGEHESYYKNYAEQPAQKLARCLAEGFVYQGEPSPTHKKEPRGTPSAHLPPTDFILFLQNHDQIGNRAFGERLTTLIPENNLRAAITLQLLCPAIPLLFMGEEWGTQTPFLFFTDFHDELATAVREGRRKEFAALTAFSDPEVRHRIPDPNAIPTYTASVPNRDEKKLPHHQRYLTLYEQLLTLRREFIAPFLKASRSLGADAIGTAAVVAQWQLNNGSVLSIAANFGHDAVRIENITGTLLFASDNEVDTEKLMNVDSATELSDTEAPRLLAAHSTRVYLQSVHGQSARTGNV